MNLSLLVTKFGKHMSVAYSEDTQTLLLGHVWNVTLWNSCEYFLL